MFPHLIMIVSLSADTSGTTIGTTDTIGTSTWYCCTIVGSAIQKINRSPYKLWNVHCSIPLLDPEAWLLSSQKYRFLVINEIQNYFFKFVLHTKNQMKLAT